MFKKPWTLSIMTVNINGMNSSLWNSVTALHRSKCDIIFVQETKLKGKECTEKLKYAWKVTTDGEAFVSKANLNGSGGVAILLSSTAANLIQREKVGDETYNSPRYITITGKIHGIPITLHSVYAPVERQERPNFFDNLPRPTNESLHIVGGDFNCVFDPHKDCVHPNQQALEGSTELISWCADLNLRDIWRVRNPASKVPTSPSQKNRIDFVLLSEELCANAQAHINPKTAGSDHWCPTAVIGSVTKSKKRGHWQMPLWVLPRIAKPLAQLLDNFSSQPEAQQATSFPALLKNINLMGKRAQKAANHRYFSSRVRLQNLWRHTHNLAICSPTPANIAAAIKARELWKKELSLQIKKKMDASFDIHFSKAERNSSFFFRRPAARRTTTAITEVKTPEGTVTKDPKKIAEIHRTFWKHIFSKFGNGSEPALIRTDRQPLLDSIQKTLSDHERAELDSPLSAKEIAEVIKSLPRRKATGLDGIRGEIFQLHVEKWAKILSNVFEIFVHSQHRLPSSFRSSVIILLYKKGATSEPENYRPISLLNNVVKILTKTYAGRLKKVMHKLVPHAQTGFVPGRCITENLILLQDAFHWSKIHGDQSVILGLDFAKAYDRVQWQYLHEVLSYMKFGERWRHFIKILYKDRTAQLNVNGTLTAPFPITRGVIQGDPLSPYLFVLQTVPLVVTMERLRYTHGIALTPTMCAPPATFYADDTTIIARSPSHACDLYNIADSFCKSTGAKLHPDKCIALVVSPNHLTLPNGIPILQADQEMTILGLPMGPNISRESQIKVIVNKMLQRCTTWAHVGRTLEGRVAIAQGIILSTLWYVLSATAISQTEAKNIQHIVESYIFRAENFSWNMAPKRGCFSKQWLYTPKAKGGLGMRSVIDILRTRKLCILRQFFNQKSKREVHSWHIIAEHLWQKATHGWGKNGEDILFWKYQQTHSCRSPGQWESLSPWWQCTLAIWLKQSWTIPEKCVSLQSLADFPVWNNRLLAQLNGQKCTLHRTANGSTSKRNYKTMRALDFLHFRDFLSSDLEYVLSSKELHAKVTLRRLHQTEDMEMVSKRACFALSKRINTLWTAAKSLWLSPTGQESRQETRFPVRWILTCDNTELTEMSNKKLFYHISLLTKRATQLTYTKVDGRSLNIQWCKERTLLSQLAPTRRDLLFRLQRNGLPLGIKRAVWGTPSQVQCPHCRGATESARHLFWDCWYAQNIWNLFSPPWKNENRGPIEWTQVLTGVGVNLASGSDVCAAQIWTIIRGCVLRVIWLERNFRVFNPNNSGKEWQQRANQAALDIRAHIESANRRIRKNVIVKWKKHIGYLISTNQICRKHLWETGGDVDQ